MSNTEWLELVWLVTVCCEGAEEEENVRGEGNQDQFPGKGRLGTKLR